MPTKTSIGPNEVVRLEVLRLTPPLQLAASSQQPVRTVRTEGLQAEAGGEGILELISGRCNPPWAMGGPAAAAAAACGLWGPHPACPARIA
jgi:hypothetical protein